MLDLPELVDHPPRFGDGDGAYDVPRPQRADPLVGMEPREDVAGEDGEVADDLAALHPRLLADERQVVKDPQNGQMVVDRLLRAGLHMQDIPRARHCCGWCD